MLSGRGLCDELITRPEESYRLWCIVVCDLETSRIGAPYIYDISSLRVNGSRTAISNGPNYMCDSPSFSFFNLDEEMDSDSKTLCYFPSLFRTKARSSSHKYSIPS